MITTNEYARGQGSVGIFGITPKATIGPLPFYNSFWIFALGFFYLWLTFKLRPTSQFDIRIPIVILLLFLVTSKILTPQYILWFALLVPLIKPSESRKNSLINLFLLLLTLFLSQYIYPLQYNGLLGIFYATGKMAFLFWILALRNLLLVILLFRYIREIVVKK